MAFQGGSPAAIRARAELERRRRARVHQVVREPLEDFVPRITPDFAAPHHLRPLLDILERCKNGEPVRALISVPPQHGKTETILHALPQLLGIYPKRQYAYVTYQADLTRKKSELAHKYAVKSGIPLAKGYTMSRWQTVEGGGFLATSIEGALTGEAISGGLIIDDPFKNRDEAESLVVRDSVHGWAKSTGFTRVHPGAFILVVHTRWHEDDLIGRLERETRENDDGDLVKKWEVVNLPAISDDGKALWPEGRPISFLRDMRGSIGEYDFSALYLGRPRPRGHNVFRGVQYYDQLPNRFRIGKGLDLAYSGKNRADWSCAVVVAECDGDIYVLDVVHKRSDVRSFLPHLKVLDAKWPGPWNFLCSGIEAALIDLAPLDGVDVNIINAVSDKFARAQPIAARWNGDPAEDDPQAQPTPGRVFLPRNAPWLIEFLEELTKFTGVGDANDDQVDGLSSAFWDFRDEGRTGVYVPPTMGDTYRFPDYRGY